MHSTQFAYLLSYSLTWSVLVLVLNILVYESVIQIYHYTTWFWYGLLRFGDWCLLCNDPGVAMADSQ